MSGWRVSTMELRLALGRGIAEQRRRHGLSQPELARMLGRPVAWVSQLERGLGPDDPMSVLEAVACALGMPLPGGSGTCRTRAVSASAAHALRRLLRPGHQHGAGTADRVPSAACLRGQADQAWALIRARRYDDLAELLAVLLPDLDAALAGPPGRPRAGVYELKSASYQACSAALASLGQHDSAKTAASRALTAAQRAGNLILAADSAYLLVCIHMGAGRHDYAEETAHLAVAALARQAAEGRSEAIALRGALTLQRALIAARTGRQAAAQDQLDRAREMAGWLSRAGACPPDIGFGPDHVALYEIAVSIEAGAAAARSAGRDCSGSVGQRGEDRRVATAADRD
jgi:transcriptional regulator with XRE-family HTH domain